MTRHWPKLILLCAWLLAWRTEGASSPGAVVAWGYNAVTNVPVTAKSGVIAIAAGGHHALALRSDGSVVAWGWNLFGQTNVPVAAQSGVTAIAAGWGHSLALKNDGSVVAWGAGTVDQHFNQNWGQSIVPEAAQSGVIAIAAGEWHSAAVKSDGSVLVWGRDWEGQTNVPPEASSNVVAVAAGGVQTAALKENGSVVVWGGASPASGWNDTSAVEVGGAGGVLFLKSTGDVETWGSGGLTNVPTAARSNVTAIAAGDFHGLALKSDGSVVVWGDNSWGQTNTPLAGRSGVMAISAGDSTSMALVSLPAPFEIKRSGNDLLLTWPTNAPGFTLQSSAQLGSSATWLDVTNPPALLGAQWAVTNPFTGGAQYFRLRKQ